MTMMLRRSDSSGCQRPASFSAAELLQRGEEDAASTPVRQLGAQLITSGHLGWLLRQQLAGEERVVELVIKISAVGKHDNGRVAQRGMREHLIGVQLHFHG